jgi:hypothetical protein
MLSLGAFLWLIDGFTGPLPGGTGRGVLSAGAAGAALLGVAFLVSALLAHARVSHQGVLSVRSWPPWQERRVDLAALAEVRGRRGPIKVHNVNANVETTVLTLRDQHGREVRLNAWYWANGDRLLAAVRTGVQRSGATVDERAGQHLADPRVGRYR